MKINCGCGSYPLAGYINVDADPQAPADVRADVLEYLAGLAAGTIDEVWACHFLEHLYRPDAERFLGECHRVLKPGGKLGVVVPDMRAVLTKYVNQSDEYVPYPDLDTRWHLDDLDEVCGLFLYGSVQESQHRWSYDAFTLRRFMQGHGFAMLKEIDRLKDARLGAPAWFQCGFEGVKNGA